MKRREFLYASVSSLLLMSTSAFARKPDTIRRVAKVKGCL